MIMINSCFINEYMIYPEFFPEDRKNEFAEKKVFEQLKRI